MGFVIRVVLALCVHLIAPARGGGAPFQLRVAAVDVFSGGGREMLPLIGDDAVISCFHLDHTFMHACISSFIHHLSHDSSHDSFWALFIAHFASKTHFLYSFFGGRHRPL